LPEIDSVLYIIILSEPLIPIKFTQRDDFKHPFHYNDAMREILSRFASIVIAVAALMQVTACPSGNGHVGNPVEDESLGLMTRLESVDFDLVSSDPEAVAVSWEALEQGQVLPDPWPLELSGGSESIPPPDPDQAFGITHSNGRRSVIYMLPGISDPSYEQIVPLAVAHYYIPEPRQDIILLLTAFQTDPSESLQGIGVISVNTDGLEMSAPFALALKPEDLSGRFFYDEFVSGDSATGLAGRPEWDQGVLLLVRLREDAVLSVYLPWY
jgi:hypothetical protein